MCEENGCLEYVGEDAENIPQEMKKKIAAVKKADKEAGIAHTPVTNEVARSLEGAE